MHQAKVALLRLVRTPLLRLSFALSGSRGSIRLSKW